MKPVGFRTAATTLVTFLINIIAVFIKILKIDLNMYIFIPIMIFIFFIGMGIINIFFSKEYVETKENNDSLFIGFSIFFILTFFIIVIKFS